ncbi:MAG: kynureninase [Saprospiraceae bacterium]
MNFEADKNFAIRMDHENPLKGFRDKFHLPQNEQGEPLIYLCGNSLGLQPRQAQTYVQQELDDWAKLGVEGHFQAKNPWMPYHEFLTLPMAEVVGAMPEEVVVMNSLTTNLHLMMVSFYRPTNTKFKILMEYNAFPSDRYAVVSQIKFHGFDPKDALIELYPREGESALRTEDILRKIDEEGDQIALIMIGSINYYTGQAFDLKSITEAGHKKSCVVGFDHAHAAGNLDLGLHDNGADFGVWCSYKYLNSGPGGLSGAFVHARHANNPDLPRFSGWWGHDKETRFKMRPDFVPMAGAEGWQLSNPPILPMATLRASLEIFQHAGIARLRTASLKLTSYLEYLLKQIQSTRIELITPEDPQQRGCQLSIRVKGADKGLFGTIGRKGVIADWREPDVIRIAPVPLYNTFEEQYRFAEILRESL